MMVQVALDATKQSRFCLSFEVFFLLYFAVGDYCASQHAAACLSSGACF